MALRVLDGICWKEELRVGPTRPSPHAKSVNLELRSQLGRAGLRED